jgi:hypothetical protein
MAEPAVTVKANVGEDRGGGVGAINRACQYI